ncbi:EAL domain-containing protein [Shewanella sp. Isolate11]|uniref:EAL domain-containing protein n=1 Tax=Shewanella sp. Isolate11 TaxID=2908530 RepID=UPI001EFCE5E9|nr:EAL domain-containing protein [Shewanella sp. Isolate11]MCG9698262.1 EAL domain-containing protein [Shewanella sp. Isolate11]
MGDRYGLRFIACCALLVAMTMPVSATDLVQRVFSARDGLGNATVNDISFDEYGYTWLSTEAGLYRISDTNARRIDSNGKNIRLSDEVISFTTPLSKTHLLVSSYTNTYLYNLLTDEFVQFGSGHLFPNFKRNGLHAMTRQNDGSYILLDYSGKLYHFDYAASSLTLITQLPQNPDQPWSVLAKVGNDQLIVGNRRELQLRDSLGMLRAVFPWDESLGLIKNLFEDSAGRLWLSSSRGLYRVYPDEVKVEKVPEMAFYITKMAQDKLGNLWLSSREDLLKWNPDTHLFKRFRDELKRAADLDYVYDIGVDDNNLIWVGGSGDGLAVLADEPEFVLDNFTHKLPYQLEGEMVWGIYSEQDRLWLGVDKGLIDVDRRNKSSKLILPEGMEVNDSVYSLLPLDDKHLLLGTTNGLYVYYREQQTAERFSHWSGGKSSLENKMVYFNYPDPLLTQRIWFVSATGVFYWDKNTLEPVEVPVKSVGGSVRKTAIRSIFRDTTGRLWLGGDNAFGYLDENQVFYSRNDIFADANISVDVSYIKEVEPGVLWLGTSPKGLVEYHPKSGKVQMLSQKWQLDCSSVYFVEQSPRYRVVGCATSLVRQDLNSGEVKVFKKQDGLISDELNDGAAYYEPNVGLYVGSPDGVALLDVAKLTNRLANNSVMLESVSAYYQDKTNVALNPVANMVIEPGVRMISFQLTSQDYLTDTPLQLQYRLHRKNNTTKANYLQLNGQSQVNVTGLSAGQYTLDILSEHNGLWSKRPYSYSFIVEDYWWNHGWFKALLLVSLLLGGLTFFWLRQQQIDAFKRVNHALQDSEERLRQSLRGSDSKLWEWHRNTGLFSLESKAPDSPTAEGSVMVTHKGFPIHEDDNDGVMLAWQRVLDKHDERFDVEYRYRRKDDTWGWNRVRGRPVEFDPSSGLVNKVAGIYTDITAQRQLEDDVKLLAQAFANTSEGVLILDADERIKVSNKAAQSIFEMSAEELSEREFSDLVHHSKERSDDIHLMLDQKRTWTGEHEFYASNDTICPVWLNLSTMNDERGMISHYVAVFSDITERKRTEADLRRLANYDVLTGLPNRSSFSQRLAKTIEHSNPDKDKLALLFLDLDRFKNVNDSYGHSMGDALLVEASNRLQSSVGEQHTLCRFGGDEFVILLGNQGDIDEINHLCEAIIQQIEKPFKLFGREFFISTSIGVSLWPDDALQPESLIKNADQAMYYAKDIGRGNFQYFSAERNVEALYHLKLEADLRKAIEREEFELYFQPQIDTLNDDRVVGVEALLRWCHPKEGYIPADIFIKVAESCGLIIDIDRWVLKQACIQGAQWAKQLDYTFKLSVNVSAVQFRQPGFIQYVKQLLDSTGMSPQGLGLEITEGVLMKELHIAKSHLKALRELGIRVAIDDFGTGYSSLAYLRSFDVSTLKIDRSFLIDIANNEADQAIVSSIIELARNLKLKVVAEGVETQEQLEQVLGRGCYVIQGYYFSKPMAVEDFENFLSHKVSETL